MVISITPKQFLELMTEAEVVAIMQSLEPKVVYLRTLCLASERIRGDDVTLVAGIQTMKTAGLLNSATVKRIKTVLKIDCVTKKPPQAEQTTAS